MTTGGPSPGRRPRDRLRRVLRGDRGSASAELAVATPVLLLMLMLIVQFALWSHASHVARAAAAQGLGAARTLQGTDADGTREASGLLAQLAGGPLADPLVETTRDATSVTVIVSGTVTPVVPFLDLPVRAVAAGPVERFTPDERPVR